MTFSIMSGLCYLSNVTMILPFNYDLWVLPRMNKSLFQVWHVRSSQHDRELVWTVFHPMWLWACVDYVFHPSWSWACVDCVFHAAWLWACVDCRFHTAWPWALFPSVDYVSSSSWAWSCFSSVDYGSFFNMTMCLLQAWLWKHDYVTASLLSMTVVGMNILVD